MSLYGFETRSGHSLGFSTLPGLEIHPVYNPKLQPDALQASLLKAATVWEVSSLLEPGLENLIAACPASKSNPQPAAYDPTYDDVPSILQQHARGQREDGHIVSELDMLLGQGRLFISMMHSDRRMMTDISPSCIQAGIPSP